MKYGFRSILGALVVASLWVATNAWADNNAQNNAGKMTANEMIIPSSRLSDLNVYNFDNQNSKLGHLSNLIINAHTGQVLYGILDTGIGGKYIPVPWAAFWLDKAANKDQYWMLLKKTQNDLANAPTFSSKHMPDFTDSQWQKSVDDFFGVHSVAMPAGNNNQGGLTTNQMIFQSSHLSDLNVYNRADANRKLGNLDNLIINAHTAQVLYGILDTGVGGKTIAVPWSAFQLQKAADKDNYWLTLEKTQDQLANAPTFDSKHMPDFTNSTWQHQVDQFFGVRTAARPPQQR